MSQRCSRVAPTSTARSSSPRPLMRCSRPSTSPTRTLPVLASPSTGARSAAISSSRRAGCSPVSPLRCALAPGDGVGVVAFTNGARGAHGWLGLEVSGILGQVVGAPDEAIRTDVPHRPEMWSDLCGRYSLRGSWRDVDKWLMAGAQIVVRSGRLSASSGNPDTSAARAPVVSRRRRRPVRVPCQSFHARNRHPSASSSARKREHPRRPSISRWSR